MPSQAITEALETHYFCKVNIGFANHLCRLFGERIGIFGSFARGEEKQGSDVDVLVEFTPGQATLHNIVTLADYLESLFGKKVDLVTVGGIDPYIRSHVEREVIWIEG